MAGAQSPNDGDKGFVENLKKFPDGKIVDHRTGNNNPACALSNSESMLPQDADLVGPFADSEVDGDVAIEGLLIAGVVHLDNLQKRSGSGQ